MFRLRIGVDWQLKVNTVRSNGLLITFNLYLFVFRTRNFIFYKSPSCVANQNASGLTGLFKPCRNISLHAHSGVLFSV